MCQVTFVIVRLILKIGGIQICLYINVRYSSSTSLFVLIEASCREIMTMTTSHDPGNGRGPLVLGTNGSGFNGFRLMRVLKQAE